MHTHSHALLYMNYYLERKPFSLYYSKLHFSLTLVKMSPFKTKKCVKCEMTLILLTRHLNQIRLLLQSGSSCPERIGSSSSGPSFVPNASLSFCQKILESCPGLGHLRYVFFFTSLRIW